MKTRAKYILLSTLLASLFNQMDAQTINWANLSEEKRNIFNANIGIEYGTVFGIGYGYKIKSAFPMIANIEFSIPSGEKLSDDFKTKMGIQINWIEKNNFRFTTKIHGVFRRYENNFSRLLNFGSDFSGIVGYYRSKWFFAGEIGFDKAIITHFKHSEIYKEQFPAVVDGWYEPATGGNFYYGIQSGVTLGKNELYLRAGKVISQDFKTDPLVPFFAQIGYNIKF